ncbi:MAG: histidine kinase [Bacteroidetes bacterium]|nr:histidine kinase [Bacteroidota bacterium]
MRKTILFILFHLVQLKTFAQDFPALKFSHITTVEGLSNNKITSIAQDKKGFIWVGTEDGLNRLDGYRVKKFYHQPGDTTSLVNNQIKNIRDDGTHNLWMSTVGGISYFNSSKYTFTNFIYRQGDAPIFHTAYSTAIYIDSLTHEAWISANKSLYKFDRQLKYQEVAANTRMLPEKYKKIKDELQYEWMYADKQHRLWSSFGSLLLNLDTATKTIVRVLPTPFVESIYSFVEDKYNNFWVASFGSGLYKLNLLTKAFEKIPLDGNPYFVHALCEWIDKNNNYWIVAGTEAGLILLDPVSGVSKTYIHDPFDNYSISATEPHVLFVDRQGILWAGTDNGINYIEPSKQLFESWDIEPKEEKIKGISPSYSYSFCETDDLVYTSTWQRQGIFFHSPNGGPPGLFPFFNLSSSQKINNLSNYIYAIVKQKDGRFWFTTDAGLVYYNAATRHPVLYKPADAEDYIGLRTVVALNDSSWWIRTRNNSANGIYVFNPIKKQFIRHYTSQTDNCSLCLPPRLRDIIITKDKNIYVAPSENYLYVLDKVQDKFVPLFNTPEQLKQFPSKDFDCLAEDDQGNLWVGTKNGLFEIDPRQKKIISDYSTNKKMSGVSILALCFDENQNLWMNTERGLYCIVHTSGDILNFSKSDGLPSDLLQGFLVKGRNGFMYSGALGYVVKFKPEELLHQHADGSVGISEINVMDRNRETNTAKALTVDPDENLFSVDFSVLNYDNGSINRYYYMLEPRMNELKENENGHLVFNNLPPGNYTLHLKGGDKYGGIFKDESALSIRVVPHWWQTLLSKIIFLVIIAALIIFFVRRRIYNIRHEAEWKQKIAETEMMALRTQMNPHFIFNCMNIIDGLITSNRKEDAKDFLQKFSRLIRLVLENSQRSQVLLEQDLLALKLYIGLEAVRFNHQFTYEFNVDKELLDENYKIPPLLLQPYVENAIIHGLHNKENGKAHLSITIKEDDNKIVAIIEDNGIGRKKSALLNAENKKSGQHLGMNLTAKRIEMISQIHKSKASVSITDMSDDEDTGTRVIITLPGDL